MQQSQQCHVDQEDYRQVKVFLYVRPVFPDTGPLTVVPVEDSCKIFASVENPFGRIDDQLIYRECSRDNLISLTGEVADVVFVDTTHLYHMGGRTRQGSRLVLVIHFVPFTCIMEPNATTLKKSIGRKIQRADGEITDKLLLTKPSFEEFWRDPPRSVNL